MAYEIREGLTPDQRSAVIEHMVGELHERLLGNGQPGEIEKIGGRLTRLERWQERATGALMLAAKIIAVIGVLGALCGAAAAIARALA